MPPTLARFRRSLGRLLTPGLDGPDPWGEGGGDHAADQVHVVPLTVRTRTADDADIRLLLEARLASATLPPAELERMALALVVPAVAQWVRRRDLAALEADLVPGAPGLDRGLAEVCGEVRGPVSALGGDLLSIGVVAGEHLLRSPSGDVVDGPG